MPAIHRVFSAWTRRATEAGIRRVTYARFLRPVELEYFSTPFSSWNMRMMVDGWKPQILPNSSEAQLGGWNYYLHHSEYRDRAATRGHNTLLE
jgi:hypothetical protein